MAKLGANWNFNSNQAVNMRLENISAGSTSANAQGRMISDGSVIKWYDGSTWRTISDTTQLPNPATSSAIGLVQLAGDLGGTGSSSTVPVLLAANTSLTSLANVTTINSSGSLRLSPIVGVGSAPSATASVFVSSSISASASVYGINLSNTFNAQTSGTVTGISVANIITLSTTTSSIYAGIHILTPTMTASTGSSMGAYYGIQIDGMGTVTNLTGPSNAYSFYSSSPSIGSTNWNVYAAGSAPSFFGGSVQLSAGGVLTGSFSGTYTLAGVPTLTSPTINSPAITNPSITSGGNLAGTFTGTYTLSGTPTISSPSITTPTITNPSITSGGTLAGSFSGTYTLAGTPTISSPTINTPTITNPSITSGGSLSGTFSGTPTFSGAVTFSTDINVQGNIVVTGELKQVSGTQINVGDILFLFNNDATSATLPALSGQTVGWSLKRFSTGTTRQDASFLWNESSRVWQSTVLNSTGSVSQSLRNTNSFVVSSSATITANVAYVITHNLNTLSPNVKVYEVTSKEEVIPSVVVQDADNVQLTFSVSQASGFYTIAAFA